MLLPWKPFFLGEWENYNLTVPDDFNKTELEQARNTFQFDGPGSFSLNMKSVVTLDKDINYIEVCNLKMLMIYNIITLILKGYIRIKDADKSDYGALLLAGGVHFLNSGSLYMMAVPEG